jgi:hypothetical protein
MSMCFVRAWNDESFDRRIASKSAIKQAYNENLKQLAQKAWTQSPRYDRMKNLKPSAPSNKYLMLIAPLPRKAASILTQLRTGHTPLAKYLHHIKKVDSPTCPACKQNDKSVQHYILHCPAHQQARQQLRNNIGGRDISLKNLFAKSELMRVLFQYVTTIQRFRSVYGNIPALREEEREERRR